MIPPRGGRSQTQLAKARALECVFSGAEAIDYDRSIDPVTGAQRFDMTPPAGLARPPP